MKKNFKDDIPTMEELNPVLQFISAEPEVFDDSTNEYRVKRQVRKKSATRSKRLMVLTTPELHKGLQAAAAKNDISVNELINEIFEQFLAKKG